MQPRLQSLTFDLSDFFIKVQAGKHVQGPTNIK
jgi:hypothetical protein